MMNTFVLPAPEENQYQFKGKTISIPFKYIVVAAYLYMVIPISIFFLTWLKWYIGIPATVILIIGLRFLLNGNYINDNKKLIVPFWTLILAGFAILLWAMYSGLGGFFFQTGDIHFRNAVFHDMVDFSWPIIYPHTNNALVYYHMFWIVPALLGKLFGWTIANLTRGAIQKRRQTPTKVVLSKCNHYKTQGEDQNVGVCQGKV